MECTTNTQFHLNIYIFNSFKINDASEISGFTGWFPNLMLYQSK